jgi:hypothetical protein
MKYGVCNLSVVPCRAEASDKSEIVTQLLFGELLKVYEKKQSWFRVKTQPDGYECYVDEKQFELIDEDEFLRLKKLKPFISSDLAQVVTRKSDHQIIPIVLGSTIYELKDYQFTIGNQAYHFEGNTFDQNHSIPKDQLKENAFMYLNAPYLWGGRSPFGIDCSGFVQLVYKMNGIDLPRDAYQQAKIGQTLSFIEEAEEGDLAFFDNDEGSIIHVGIMLENNRIIHASGKVRIDRIDHQGIYNVESKTYSHRLRLIKSVI